MTNADLERISALVQLVEERRDSANTDPAAFGRRQARLAARALGLADPAPPNRDVRFTPR